MVEEKMTSGKKVRAAIKTVIALLLFAFYMFPFYMIVLNSLKDKRDITKGHDDRELYHSL